MISTLIMGFDINVMIALVMCPKTGKPFYYGIDKETKLFGRVYGLPDLEVPEEFHSYLEGRGHIFHAYTGHFNKEDRYNVDVNEFLDNFPSWQEVQASDAYVDDDDYWTEDDHNGFYSLIQWCVKQQVEFRVSWSF